MVYRLCAYPTTENIHGFLTAGDGFIDFQEFKRMLEHPQLQALVIETPGVRW